MQTLDSKIYLYICIVCMYYEYVWCICIVCVLHGDESLNHETSKETDPEKSKGSFM